jgi:hypothetical protein
MARKIDKVKGERIKVKVEDGKKEKVKVERLKGKVEDGKVGL